MTQKQRIHRAATSEAMKRVAERRKCEACGRKNATTRHEMYEVIIKVCRYCGHKKTYNLDCN